MVMVGLWYGYNFDKDLLFTSSTDVALALDVDVNVVALRADPAEVRLLNKDIGKH